MDKIVKTGFNNLDEQFQGFFRGNLYVVGGITSVGKTTFVANIIYNQIINNNNIFIVSLQEKEKYVYERLRCIHSRKNNVIEDSNFEKKLFLNLRICLENKVDEILPRAGSWHVSNPLNILIIDDFRNLEVYRNNNLALNKAFKKLKQFAIDTQSVVIVTSQLNINYDNKLIPVKNDLEHSSILKRADGILVLHNSFDIDNYVNLIINKNKGGKRTKIEFIFEKKYRLFEEIPKLKFTEDKINN